MIFYRLRITHPFYLDIGAHHPTHFNNTYLFYLKGASGINVEADSDLVVKFAKLRPLDLNLNFAIGGEEAEGEFFHMSAQTLNTISREEAHRVQSMGTYSITSVSPISIKTYTWLIENYVQNKPIDLLNLDIEGMDEMVIRSIDFTKHRPKVICVETIIYDERSPDRKNHYLIDFLKSINYFLYADTHINSIFIASEELNYSIL